MIASPSDVSAERAIIRELLSEWSIVHADRTRTVLLPIGWETHSVPEMGGRPQAIINKQILKDCDLLIGVFWTRIGTPTGEFASGTVEEIEEHLKAGKPTMLYFSSVPVIPESIDSGQYLQLSEFRKSCQSRGLYESYSDLTDFRAKLYRQLQLKLLRDGAFQQGMPSQGQVAAASIPALSKEAVYLLKECAADPHATIMNVSYLGGQAMQVGGKNLIEDGNDRSRATWTSALAELEAVKYVEPLGHKRELFRITRKGMKPPTACRRWSNTSIEARSKGRFAPFGPRLMSNVGRRRQMKILHEHEDRVRPPPQRQRLNRSSYRAHRLGRPTGRSASAKTSCSGSRSRNRALAEGAPEKSSSLADMGERR